MRLGYRRKKMTYEIGYLYQTTSDGRDFANGHGPLQNNLKIVSTHSTQQQAMAAGAKLIGSKSSMGTVADAYLVRRTSRTTQILGQIGSDAILDTGWARLKQAL
jgi:hypothetical protein